jgi:hypothetical protein
MERSIVAGPASGNRGGRHFTYSSQGSSGGTNNVTDKNPQLGSP